nr:chlorophyll a-b binding protein 7, chloroplastic isoform X2 [Ipomoea trifida]
MPQGNSETQSHIHLPIHQDKLILFNIIFLVFKPFSFLSTHNTTITPCNCIVQKSIDMASACAASSTIAAAAFSSPSSQTKVSFLSGRKLRVSKYSAPATSRSFTVCATADPNQPL